MYCTGSQKRGFVSWITWQLGDRGIFTYDPTASTLASRLCEEEAALRSSAWIIAYYRKLLSMSTLMAIAMALQLALLRCSFQVSRSLKTMQSIYASQGSNHWQQLIDITFNYNCFPFLFLLLFLRIQ